MNLGFFLGLCFRTQSGTFKDGDLRVNKDGVRIVSQSEPEAVTLSSSLVIFLSVRLYSIGFEVLVMKIELSVMLVGEGVRL